jgi:hypothetical protein
MQDQIDDIQRDMKEVKEALLGTKYGQKGIVDRVKCVEEYQSKDKKQKWMVAGAALVLGTIGKFWKDLIEWIS